MQHRILALALILSGCGSSGGDRWLSATRENVQIDGAPFHVRWLKAGPRKIDFTSHRDQSFVMNIDQVAERRRNIEAASVVARRECGTQRVEADGVDRADQMYSGRIRCL